MLFVLLILVTFSFISAQDDAVDKGYDCLKTALGDNCGDVKSTEQNAYNLLAMAYDSTVHKNCKDKLLEKKQANNCWGDSASTACNVKSTALAILALNYVDDDVTDYVEYLDSKTKTVTDLTWYLQIDASNETECTINGKKVTILENKKIRGQNPTGLTVAYNGYWYKVNDLTKNYSISCDRDFISALLYQRPGSTTYHIPSDTHYASAHDSTIERVKAECFTISGVCDYESSLWATLSLATSGEEVSPYIPYLLAMSEDPKYRNLMPAAFLYMLYGSSDEYYTTLVQQQKQNKYWDESGNKFYDTSIALLALGDYGYDVVDNAKEYLLSVQGGDGCWGSTTALILHAGWPRLPTSSSDDNNDDGTLYCDRFGFYCISQGECPATDILDDYRCISSVDICCESKPAEPTCSDKGGEVCGMDEDCSNNEYIIASDTSYCCGSSCEERVVEENLCIDLGYTCTEQCGPDEVEKESYNIDCGFDVCCGQVEDTGGTNWLWIIILLIILIILVILAIVFKDQLRVALFKKKSKLRSDRHDSPGGPPRRPPIPPPGYAHRSHAPRTSGPPRGPPKRGPPVRRPTTTGKTKDKDFDDTMKKLRDMSN